MLFWGGNEFNLGHFEFEAFVTHVNGTVPCSPDLGWRGSGSLLNLWLISIWWWLKPEKLDELTQVRENREGKRAWDKTLGGHHQLRHRQRTGAWRDGWLRLAKPEETNQECSVKEARRKTGWRSRWSRWSARIKCLKGLCNKKVISDRRGGVEAWGQVQQLRVWLLCWERTRSSLAAEKGVLLEEGFWVREGSCMSSFL